MDDMLVIAIASAVAGWCVAFHQMRQRERYRLAWRMQCGLRILAEDSTLHWRNLFAKEAAKLIVADSERDIAKHALKCALETKSAVEAALAESEQFGRDAVDLSTARWKQIQELEAQLSGVSK